MGERCVRNAEVMGSNPTISTKSKRHGITVPFTFVGDVSKEPPTVAK